MSSRKRRKPIRRASHPPTPSKSIASGPRRLFRTLGLVVAISFLGALVYIFFPADPDELANPAPSERRATTPNQTTPAAASQAVSSDFQTRYYTQGKLTMVWDTIRADVQLEIQPTSLRSNIAPAAYVGPNACVECHPQNHADWSQHPHRWMNAMANGQSVMGDFTGNARIEYRGGQATFYREAGKYKMRFDRQDPELHREYEITQTIGSRFYQYYVGKGVVGPEPQEHDFYRVDFVLPFGYWLDRQAWVPIVHVHDESPEDTRWESVEELKPPAWSLTDGAGVGRARGVFDRTADVTLTYSLTCNYCHTSFPLADMFVRMPDLIGPTIRERSYFALSDYVAQSHPDIWDGSQPPETFPSEAIEKLTGTFIAFKAPEKAVTLGVSCEACHLGCRDHAEHAEVKPPFAPRDPHLFTYHDPASLESGRTVENVNAICGRCHAGNRPTYAAGMATWNSTEHSDAMRGGCYSQLTCIDCHDPHKATGKKWTKTADEDDASCLKCHDEYAQPQFRQLHTHHASGTAGDRCMNCHMPKINEGMQDVVRTHAIFSPTEPEMLHANHPNACNLCHLDRSINWTLGYLQSWYGRIYSDPQIDRAYSDRRAPVGLGWLEHSHEATRLVASQALAEQRAAWALPQLVERLDDPYLMNRQFAQQAVENLIGDKLDEKCGYWYYMTQPERQQAISDLKRQLEIQ